MSAESEVRSPNRHHDDPLPEWIPPAYVRVPIERQAATAMIPFEEDEPTLFLLREAGARPYRWHPWARTWTVRVDLPDLVEVLSARWPVVVEFFTQTGDPITEPGFGWHFECSTPIGRDPSRTCTRFRVPKTPPCGQGGRY